MNWVNCMIEIDDWRLLNDVEYLKGKCINPTSGAEILHKTKNLKKCVFCWDEIDTTEYSVWFILEDLSCCICEECCNDFDEMFKWKKLDGWDIKSESN